jgi:HEAT repeat protein
MALGPQGNLRFCRYFPTISLDGPRSDQGQSTMTEARTAQEEESKESQATAKAVAGWVNHLGRTLKTCRLYDLNNPTVIRFREELGTALARLLDEQGPITLRFTDEDLLFEEHSLYPARSRDDNLGLAFHRDGIRSITLSPGIRQDEVEKLLDAILQVSGQNIGQDDLVTLLWEAHLPHLDLDYVPSDGDIGSADVQAEGESSRIPWPQGKAETDEPGPDAATAPPPGESPSGPRTRSDDWTTGELTAEIEAGFGDLDALSPAETRRFLEEFQAEHEVSTTTTALAIVRATLQADASPEDRSELAEFTPRLLRLSIARGAWLEAVEAMHLLTECGGETLVAPLIQELLQPISVSTIVEHLDQQEEGAVEDFIQFAKTLGDTGVDLLISTLAESQQRRNRRILAETIAELCKEAPERLAPWLADRRWYVVRNMVHILGWIGGDSIVGLLRSTLSHPEPRVRQEAVAAIGQVDPALARPILLKALGNADTRMFCAVLHQLSAARDIGTARVLMGYLLDPHFDQRPQEERRAIYSALSGVASDEVVPELEAELMKGNWFARGQEAHRQAVARVLARIGTTAARNVLQRGALSKRPPVRKACEDAIVGASLNE